MQNTSMIHLISQILTFNEKREIELINCPFNIKFTCDPLMVYTIML